MMDRSVLWLFLMPVIGVMAGCGSESALGECPANSQAQQDTGSQIVSTKCVTCHSSQLSGPARAGAPAGYNFDTADGVRAHAEDMYDQVSAGNMPKGGPLTDAEVESLRVYLACMVQ